MAIETSIYLDNIISQLEKAISKVTSLTEDLEESILNIPEEPNKWSMLQCIEHISIATELYVENISEKLKEPNLPVASSTYKGHWKGHMFAKMNAPKTNGEIPMKLKTFKAFDPAGNLNKEKTIQHFVEVHNKMIDLVNESRQVNIDKLKVATALGSIVRLRIGEAYRFILAHTQRHLVQLERINATIQG